MGKKFLTGKIRILCASKLGVRFIHVGQKCLASIDVANPGEAIFHVNVTQLVQLGATVAGTLI